MSRKDEADAAELARVGKRLEMHYKGVQLEYLYDRLYPQDPRRYGLHALRGRLEELAATGRAHFDGAKWWPGAGEHVSTATKGPPLLPPIGSPTPTPTPTPTPVAPPVDPGPSAPVVEDLPAEVTAPVAEVTAPKPADKARHNNTPYEREDDIAVLVALVERMALSGLPGSPDFLKRHLGWSDWRWHVTSKAARDSGRIVQAGPKHARRYLPASAAVTSPAGRPASPPPAVVGAPVERPGHADDGLAARLDAMCEVLRAEIRGAASSIALEHCRVTLERLAVDRDRVIERLDVLEARLEGAVPLATLTVHEAGVFSTPTAYGEAFVLLVGSRDDVRAVSGRLYRPVTLHAAPLQAATRPVEAREGLDGASVVTS